jgi:hypothetical protein
MPTIDRTALFRDVQRILTGADFTGGTPRTASCTAQCSISQACSISIDNQGSESSQTTVELN